ncbi:hypothetical protein ACU4GD_34370 [Cupriavidus basilensis]
MLSGDSELTLSMLDMRFDPASGFYQAPPQMKANNGIYIIDDLGRQLVGVTELLNRWIVPLDRQIDVFTLQTGVRFTVPFDVWPVFSTNLDPAQLCDAAFLRRLGSKLHVGPLSPEDYREIYARACRDLGLHTPAPVTAAFWSKDFTLTATCRCLPVSRATFCGSWHRRCTTTARCRLLPKQRCTTPGTATSAAIRTQTRRSPPPQQRGGTEKRWQPVERINAHR